MQHQVQEGRFHLSTQASQLDLFQLNHWACSCSSSRHCSKEIRCWQRRLQHQCETFWLSHRHHCQPRLLWAPPKQEHDRHENFLQPLQTNWKSTSRQHQRTAWKAKWRCCRHPQLLNHIPASVVGSGSRRQQGLCYWPFEQKLAQDHQLLQGIHLNYCTSQANSSEISFVGQPNVLFQCQRDSSGRWCCVVSAFHFQPSPATTKCGNSNASNVQLPFCSRSLWHHCCRCRCKSAFACWWSMSTTWQVRWRHWLHCCKHKLRPLLMMSARSWINQAPAKHHNAAAYGPSADTVWSPIRVSEHLQHMFIGIHVRIVMENASCLTTLFQRDTNIHVTAKISHQMSKHCQTLLSGFWAVGGQMSNDMLSLWNIIR